MKRTLVIAISALSLSAATVVGLTPSAQAASAAPRRMNYHGCAATKFCLYEKNTYKGLKASFTKSVPNLAVKLFDGSASRTVNDQGSSMINRSRHDVVLFKDHNYHGTTYLAQGNSRDSNFNSGQTFDNKASSVKFNR